MPLQNPNAATAAANPSGPERPWLVCTVPMIIFLTLGSLEPTPTGGGIAATLGIAYEAYPWIYALRLAVTLIVLATCWPSLVAWLGRPTWWPPLLGLVLVFPWVILASLQSDAGWTSTLAQRSAFNPFAHFGNDSPAAWGFLCVRAIGLVVVVPIVEEVFLRGFLMRTVIREEFWRVPFGTLTFASAGICLVYAILAHPAEAFAAVGWFAIVSGIAAATRRPIDTILAHAATNLALGVFVLLTGSWWLV